MDNILILILFGCVINPKYSEPDYMFEGQKIESPEHVAQIQKNKEAYDQWHIDQIVKPLPKESYEVKEEEISRWSMGNEKNLIQVIRRSKVKVANSKSTIPSFCARFW